MLGSQWAGYDNPALSAELGDSGLDSKKQPEATLVWRPIYMCTGKNPPGTAFTTIRELTHWTMLSENICRGHGLPIYWSQSHLTTGTGICLRLLHGQTHILGKYYYAMCGWIGYREQWRLPSHKRKPTSLKLADMIFLYHAECSYPYVQQKGWTDSPTQTLYVKQIDIAGRNKVTLAASLAISLIFIFGRSGGVRPGCDIRVSSDRQRTNDCIAISVAICGAGTGSGNR